MSKSEIEWTDETWNPVTGCTRASSGCDFCYAVTMTRRLAAMGQEKYQGLVNPGKGHFNGVVKTHADALALPLSWRKPRTVFVNSMSDLFHRDVPFEFIDKVWAVMSMTPRHTYQILTKRPDRMAELLPLLAERNAPPDGSRWPLPNVWLGTSVEDQATADERIPALLFVPAAVRFLSMEPLLGPVAIREHWLVHHHPGDAAIDWVIVGGESGPGARDCALSDVRHVVEQCRAAGVPVFVKQLGKRPVWGDSVADMHYAMRRAGTGPGDRDAKGGDIDQWPEDLRVREMPAVEVPS